MNKLKFKAMMVLHDDTQGKLSNYLGITQQSLSKRINGHSDFTQGEIIKIKNRYNLTADQIDSIFFGNHVS